MDERRRLAYLSALGVEVWREKDSLVESSPTQLKAEQVTEEQSKLVKPVLEQLRANSKQMKARDKVTVQQTIETPTVVTIDVSRFSLDQLRSCVSNCQQCGLHATRYKTVFGEGYAKAELMIIGEAPGADEDRQGEPFVGKAGQLLTQMLRAIGLTREEVFICNILKCRPPNNRDPSVDEMAACRGYLNRQIELVEPVLILAVGRIAAQSLLQVDTPVGKLRGKIHTLATANCPLVVTYHPAYLLRSPKEKAKSWQDLKIARETLLQNQVVET